MNSTNDNWTPCEPGELTELADGLRAETQRATNRRLISAASFMVAAVVLVIVALNLGGNDPAVQFGPKGGLSCGECVRLYNDFAAGSLDNELSTRVSLHLDGCPHCRRHLGDENREKSTRRSQPGQAIALFSAHRHR